jgi:hypothetical protein
MNKPKKIISTINFVTQRLDYLKEQAQNHDIPYKKLIKLCIVKYIENFKKNSFKNHALKYQEDSTDWTKVHFKMLPDEYDVYFDLKKVSRCSFSLIVAIAIDTYLDSVLNGNQEFSYPITEYIKICINENNYPIYVFCWKKTEKYEKIAQILRE